LRYTARDRPHSWQRRLIRICSRGGILTLSGVRRLAANFSSCLRDWASCAWVVILSVLSALSPKPTRGLITGFF
jgi:hypothetical protein